ncbi:hypothetical protein Pla175_14630 [Pirellulimonas nuda]|uniref:Uncharacterized protein n=1 Tax=Pirellulimonas nuda TaxID=2528009 RepID=A0A518D9D0_9BACT|nr:hypothetical protein [Pirellulimonas nuda]QDU88092.1 hypothetical protein Pla175_14630 [Pirellulimonas nuda]
MHETLKTWCVILGILAVVVGAGTWSDRHPDQLIWYGRVGSILVGLASVCGLLALTYRRDKAFDYLYGQVGKYLDRGGLCFGFAFGVNDGAATLNLFFQNRFDRPCETVVALRQVPGWMEVNDQNEVQVSFACPGGAFGVVEIPFGVPQQFQGKTQKYYVGASTMFPEGKGVQLRFRNALPVRSDLQMQSGMREGVAVGGAALGMIAIVGKETVELTFPENVRETFDEGAQIKTSILRELDAAAKR